MKISKITGEACKTTRSLWEEVFYEDSVQFTDYYFGYKAPKNIGYVIGQKPYDAMMFRTPYMLQIGREIREISYLVGVATRKECRHQGYMKELLLHSFEEMYEEKNPFTFLMPANPAIYTPFDFSYIYERDVWQPRKREIKINRLETPGELDGIYSVRNLTEGMPQLPIMEMLADFSNQYLEEHYQIYVHRDREYYEMQLRESLAQNGDIYVLFIRGEIKAFFLYAREGEEVFIQEVVGKEEAFEFLSKSEKKKPIIMARIIHLEEMMKLVCSKDVRELTIRVEDDLIPKNSGIYHWEITPRGSQVTKLQQINELKAAGMDDRSILNAEGKKADTEMISMHIRELAPKLLRGVFLNEIV